MKKTRQIALGAVVGAFSVMCMFFTGIFPFATYAFPATAGCFLVAVILESGKKWAFLTFLTAALISWIITPDKEAVLAYSLLLGYYPIVKLCYEQMKSRIIEWVLKILHFNLILAAALGAGIYLLKLDASFEILKSLGLIGILGVWIIANAVFVIYDIGLSRMIFGYIRWIRPKIMRG